MRLLIVNIVEQEGKEPQFNKSSLVRVPIRLMRLLLEKFPENIDRMCDAMTAFNLLMKVHKVQSYRACDPNAGSIQWSRNCSINKEKSDVNIEIIDGKKGGAIIASTDLFTY
jgi:exopolyphosphatase/guanosine-5'-triphosphate,3'-diphosphate pyrophosphatase